ncbi:ATPase family gene 2 protein homolog B-like isoform X2 [Saccostrea echinata]|nr:ATPase family gene 2 protein homolog B-like isoform X2 [Saccostrea echinata]XP_061173884.1 ATPase family gene 2 protein homolog B-like isoform X2 [Saccostrea echinata]
MQHKLQVRKNTDITTQKCKVDIPTLRHLGIKPGSFAAILFENTEFICQVWPIPHLSGTGIEVGTAVTRSAEQKTDKACTIKQLDVVPGKSISVSIVVTKAQDVKVYRKMKTECARSLEDICRGLLYKICVSSKAVVDKETCMLAKLHGISFILIDIVSDWDYCIVDNTTTITVNDIQSREHYMQKQTIAQTTPLGGLDKVEEELMEFLSASFSVKSNVNNTLRLPRGVLLRGPPGTGKTSLVKHICNKCNAFLISINGPEVFGSRPGETEENIKGVFEKAFLMSEEGPCVIFLDEIDSVCPKRRDSDDTNNTRSTSVFLNYLDKISDCANLAVIGATNRPAALDPSVRRPGRLDKEIMINVPTLSQRKEILRHHCSGLRVDSGLDLNEIAKMTNGYVGADLMSLCHEAAFSAMSFLQSDLIVDKVVDIPLITTEHFKEALRKVMPSTQKGSPCTTDFDPVHWEDIGGLEEAKLKIQQAVEWPIKHPEAFLRMGLPSPRGVLLYGPPGCCKTTLVKAVATSSNATFLSISGAQLFSPYVGDSEKLISEVFQRARAGAPSLIFLDEIDSIIGKRSDGTSQRGVQERVLSTLLNEMDGIGIRLDEKTDSLQTGEDGLVPDIANKSVLVVAATNRLDMLDEALTRPGRFDRSVFVPPPDIQGRLEILKICTKTMPMKDADLSELAIKTENYTGADLKNLCREAALLALTENLSSDVITGEHLNTALSIVKPSITSSLLTKYKHCPKEKKLII